MIRSLQRRFVLTAMLSLLVLLVILVSGMIAVSYYWMEKNTDTALEALSANRPLAGPSNERRRPLFGYQINPSPPLMMNPFIVTAGRDQEILRIEGGFGLDSAAPEIRQHAETVLAAGVSKGKVASYKYMVAPLLGGGYRIAFIDVSAQAHMLMDTAQASCLISLGCLVLMLIIVMLISRRTVLPIANNITKQKQFVTNAGHEVKTPLAIIQANVDAMDLHLGENKWSRHIRNQAIRLDGLMRQLLTLSQMDEGAAAMPFESVDMSALLTRCILPFLELEPAREMITHIEASLRLWGNSDSLEQLVFILLDNAHKYALAGTPIEVRLNRAGKKTVLEVINTCAALPEADPRTLFDRFYRADTARTQESGGYGIGLSIARAIAEAHHGKIHAFYDTEALIRFRVEF